MSDRESHMCVSAGTRGPSKPMRAQSPQVPELDQAIGVPRRHGFSTAKGDNSFQGYINANCPCFFFNL